MASTGKQSAITRLGLSRAPNEKQEGRVRNDSAFLLGATESIDSSADIADVGGDVMAVLDIDAVIR